MLRMRLKCREHQKAHWKAHKEFCKQRATEANPSIRLRELEDFVRLHQAAFKVALAELFQDNDPTDPIDWSKELAVFEFDSTSDSNPARSFRLKDAFITPDMPVGTRDGDRIATYRRTTYASHTEVPMPEGYINYVLCLCKIPLHEGPTRVLIGVCQVIAQTANVSS